MKNKTTTKLPGKLGTGKESFISLARTLTSAVLLYGCFAIKKYSHKVALMLSGILYFLKYQRKNKLFLT